MERQQMHLNIWYDLPKRIWDKVPDIYKQLDGWKGFGEGGGKGEEGIPYWFSYNENEKHILASVEPGGLQFTGFMKNEDWDKWVKEIKEIASNTLGFKVGDLELGEVDYEREYPRIKTRDIFKFIKQYFGNPSP